MQCICTILYSMFIRNKKSYRLQHTYLIDVNIHVKCTLNLNTCLRTYDADKQRKIQRFVKSLNTIRQNWGTKFKHFRIKFSHNSKRTAFHAMADVWITVEAKETFSSNHTGQICEAGDSNNIRRKNQTINKEISDLWLQKVVSTTRIN